MAPKSAALSFSDLSHVVLRLGKFPTQAKIGLEWATCGGQRVGQSAVLRVGVLRLAETALACFCFAQDDRSVVIIQGWATF
jgi:hypothetical protein